MPIVKLQYFENLYRPQRIPLLILLLFSFFGSLIAQEIPKEFKDKAETLVQLQPKTYEALDKELHSEKRDTSLLRYFANLSKEYNYLVGRAYALNQLGMKYRNVSQYEKAVTLHEQALAASVEANNTDFRVLSLNMLGVVYRRTDAIKTALDYNQKALELAEQVEDPSNHIKRSINVALNGIGNLYQTLEQYDLAILQFRRALKLEEELGNKLGLAINHQNIGHCLEEKGDLEGALENYRKSLAYNEDIDSDIGRLICKNSLAQIYLKQDMPYLALVLLEPLQEESKRIGDFSITSLVFINTGWAQTKLGNYMEAEDFIREGLQMAQNRNIPSNILYAYEKMSELQNTKGDFKKAYEYYKKADEYDKQISSATNLRYMNDIIVKYENDKKNNQIAVLAKENEIVRLRLKKNQTTLLVSALIVGLILSILYILYRQYQSKNEKRVLTLEQQMLRSQMNPHFLFNSLNSIKLYIINNEQKNAVHYLNKFSKLVRKILEASSQKEIPLSEELGTMELYMNIENIRFSNEIDFKIEVEEGINVDNIKIPSLTLQPFLENSLWHGLSPKDGEKKIQINVKHKDKGHVTIEIVDNGVGRTMAEVNKENRVLKRKSLGIRITKERLANFAKDYQNKFDVDILDLFDENGDPNGTKVVLDIPTI
ncbi:putative signal transduction histidine kinase [Allomuricauda ruestringensis DSM 13258]|uniref:Signal transduction histidine kinase n=1 Tax=Allomuricauda ruestringensis (strain DSM 13258 / CIP 107369 / LMG 19739 / B1) TaxID=886377 RepID=G2PQG2_ALLRU|nr:putative signal transduction histidine kinase [Allomuricauda ruestringensis DSM 13258]